MMHLDDSARRSTQQRLFRNERQMTGTVKALRVDKGYGFIAITGQPDAFFHFRDLLPELLFDEQLLERRVDFALEQNERGQRARNIQAAT